MTPSAVMATLDSAGVALIMWGVCGLYSLMAAFCYAGNLFPLLSERVDKLLYTCTLPDILVYFIDSSCLCISILACLRL